MSRPRLGVGTWGQIATAASGPRFVARVRYRDWDGATRLIEAAGDTARKAERALTAKLSQRTAFQADRAGALTPESPFPDLVRYWLSDLEAEGRLSKSTLELYERDMRTLVLPTFEHLCLREIGVARCDQLLKALARRSYSRAKHGRTVLRLAFGLAVRHEILPRNPVEGTARLHRPPSVPNALSADEVMVIREAIRAWERGNSASGPKPDLQLGAIVETMLGTGVRIGEVLALRLCDVDVTAVTPSIRIEGTIVSRRGAGAARQDWPKTATSRRTIGLSAFAAEAIRLRLARVADHSPDSLLFCTRNGTPLQTNNVRRQLRRAIEAVDIEGVTPHLFRRTVATAVSDAAGVELAAKLLGHSDARVTITHYIQRDAVVNPATASILEGTFSASGQ